VGSEAARTPTTGFSRPRAKEERFRQRPSDRNEPLRKAADVAVVTTLCPLRAGLRRRSRASADLVLNVHPPTWRRSAQALRCPIRRPSVPWRRARGSGSDQARRVPSFGQECRACASGGARRSRRARRGLTAGRGRARCRSGAVRFREGTTQRRSDCGGTAPPVGVRPQARVISSSTPSARAVCSIRSNASATPGASAYPRVGCSTRFRSVRNVPAAAVRRSDQHPERGDPGVA
jgi:hypothetical protein